MPLYQRGPRAVKGASNQDAPRREAPSAEGGGPGDEPTIVIEDEGLRAGFTQLPNYVFRIRGLSHGAKLTYALLLSYAWQKDSCFPGQQTLADDLDVSVRSVGDYLRELQERGLIRVQRRGLGKTNVYHILRLGGAAGPSPEPRAEVTEGRRTRASADRQQSAVPDQQDSADLDGNQGADPDRRRSAAVERKASAAKKDKPAQRRTSREEAEQQSAAAAATAPARAVLARWGIAEPRLVAELCAVPSEVLRQGAVLEEHLAAGRRIVNPAGWLIEAVRAGYGLAASGDNLATGGLDAGEGTTVLGGQCPPVQALRERGQLSLLAPEAPASAGQPARDEGAGEAGVWPAILEELRETTTAGNFRRWFAPLALLGEGPGELVVGVAGEQEREWLEHRLRGTLERAAEAVLGRRPAISFVLLPADEAI